MMASACLVRSTQSSLTTKIQSTSEWAGDRLHMFCGSSRLWAS
jgi:hypothetical protein